MFDAPTCELRVISPIAINQLGRKDDIKEVELTFLDSQRKQECKRSLLNAYSYEGLNAFNLQAMKFVMSRMTRFVDFSLHNVRQKDGRFLSEFESFKVNESPEYKDDSCYCKI